MGSAAAAAAQIPTSFGHELRACLRCRLVKTYDQLRESGCENCPFFNMESDHERVVECTTPNFTGIITVMDLTRSWAARWLRIVSVLPMITLPNLFLVWSLLMLQHFPGTRAWGKEGHFVICKIAEGLLSVDAAAAVKQLLPNESNGDLASTCSWADEIRYRRHWRWSSPLHYVDTPDYRCNYNYCRDCHDSAGHRDRCVSGAIYNYSSQLTTFLDISSQLKYNLTEALMFLSHFMGDIHQPLHVGFTGDYGGNTIVVRWFRRKTNLHHVWDTMIIEEAVKKIYNSNLSMMVQALMRNISENWSIAIPTWENCDSNATSCPDPYASESVRFACKYAYKNATPGSTLSDEYFKSRLPVVEKRLAQSGVRLASTLNRIFARHSSIALE